MTRDEPDSYGRERLSAGGREDRCVHRLNSPAPNGGTWDNPTTILGRPFMRFSFTLNY
jgi:hypothetical protein